MWFDVDNPKLMENLDKIVDCSHRVPVKCVQIWTKSSATSSSLYFRMSTVRNADELAAVLMDSSLYGRTIDCANINPYDCYEVEIHLSRCSGKYNTNITPEVVETLMGLTWELMGGVGCAS